MMGKMNLVALLGVLVALVGTMPPADAVCRGGLEGLESTSQDVCCTEGCTQCGGIGCAPDNSTTLTADDCCTQEILASNVLCSDSMAAPCILTTEAAPADSVCDNGLTGVQDPDTDVCCPLECGTECGGDGCGQIPGVLPSQCCANLILDAGAVCSDTVPPPCVVGATSGVTNSTCSNGLEGIENAGVCCNAACGQCGGPGCGTIVGLSSDQCCSSNIAANGSLCSVTGEAPCQIDIPEVTPSTCPNGLAGVQDGTVCCAEECGQCGGMNCGSIPGTGGSSDCCSNTILASGSLCEEGVVAPCIMINGTYTDAPTVSPILGGSVAPTAGSRGGLFSMAPTTAGQTASPSSVGTGIPTPAPTSIDQLAPSSAPSSVSRGIDLGSSGPTAAPTVPDTSPVSPEAPPTDPTDGATALSAGSLVTVAAIAAGTFAIFAAARN